MLQEQHSTHIIHTVLSKLGKRIFFPEGIVFQTEQSKTAKIQATAGMAYDNNQLLYLPEIQQSVGEDITPQEAVSYAPVAGVMELRKKWKQFLLQKNPSIDETSISTPIVTSGITHAISNTLHLILDAQDVLITPDCFWENYQHIAETVLEADFVTFSMFTKQGKFNIQGLADILETHVPEKKKATVLLNFPNNPTGYSLYTQEAHDLFDMLQHYAERGVPIVTIVDDAYFGLFYGKGVYRESLFAKLSHLHENLLAIKVDGATKEMLSWGLRIGFFTFGCKGLPEEMKVLLEKKMVAYIRASVTSSSRLSQSLVLKALKEGTLARSIAIQKETIEKKFFLLQEELVKCKAEYPNAPIKPNPCNSGYFISFTCPSSDFTHTLRMSLLKEKSIALIAIDDTLRFTFSCVNIEDISSILHTIYSYTTKISN